jgi:hypothetical protein
MMTAHQCRRKENRKRNKRQPVHSFCVPGIHVELNFLLAFRDLIHAIKKNALYHTVLYNTPNMHPTHET